MRMLLNPDSKSWTGKKKKKEAFARVLFLFLFLELLYISVVYVHLGIYVVGFLVVEEMIADTCLFLSL